MAICHPGGRRTSPFISKPCNLEDAPPDGNLHFWHAPLGSPDQNPFPAAASEPIMDKKTFRMCSPNPPNNAIESTDINARISAYSTKA